MEMKAPRVPGRDLRVVHLVDIDAEDLVLVREEGLRGGEADA